MVTNSKRLLSVKVTTTNPVKKVATRERGSVDNLSDIWRLADPWDFFPLPQYKNSHTVLCVAHRHYIVVCVKFEPNLRRHSGKVSVRTEVQSDQTSVLYLTTLTVSQSTELRMGKMVGEWRMVTRKVFGISRDFTEILGVQKPSKKTKLHTRDYQRPRWHSNQHLSR